MDPPPPTKTHLACEAVRHWEEEAVNNRQGIRTDLAGVRLKSVGTAERLSTRFGVSKGLIEVARRVMLANAEQFERIAAGLEPLPYTRKLNKTKRNSFALYRAFREDGVLLYIGITWSVGQRLAGHAAGSDWFDEYATMTVDRNFSSRKELETAERFAIQTEKPLYNVIYRVA